MNKNCNSTDKIIQISNDDNIKEQELLESIVGMLKMEIINNYTIKLSSFTTIDNQAIKHIITINDFLKETIKNYKERDITMKFTYLWDFSFDTEISSNQIANNLLLQDILKKSGIINNIEYNSNTFYYNDNVWTYNKQESIEKLNKLVKIIFNEDFSFIQQNTMNNHNHHSQLISLANHQNHNNNTLIYSNNHNKHHNPLIFLDNNQHNLLISLVNNHKHNLLASSDNN